jgi:exosortase A
LNFCVIAFGTQVTTFLIGYAQTSFKVHAVPILGAMSILVSRSAATASVSPRDAFWAIVVSLVCLLVVFRDTVAQIIELWSTSGTYEHGFAIVPIAGWLVWRRRRELSQCRVTPSVPALVGVIAAGFIWLLGKLAPAAVVMYFALVSMIVMTIIAIAGMQVARTIVFPLGFLFLAVPFGDFMVPIMVDWTADFTVSALRVTGVPVFREGNDFVISTGRWSVVEACSGIRYFHAALTGGVIFAYLVYRSTARRVLFIGLSILTPILANWLRAYLIVLIGHVSNNELASGVDHLVYGWVFFGMVMALLFWLGSRWREDHQDSTTGIAVSPRSDVGIVGSRRSMLGMAAAVIASMLISPVTSHAIQVRLDTFVPNFTIESVRAAGWQATPRGSHSWTPVLPGARSIARKMFESGSDRAGIQVAWFYGGRDKSKLVSTQNTITDRAGPWRVIGRGEARIVWRGEQRTVKRTLLTDGTQTIEVYAFYWIAGFATANDLLASGMVALAKLIYFRNDAATVFLFAIADATTRSPLDRFTADVSDSFEAALKSAAEHTLQN